LSVGKGSYENNSELCLVSRAFGASGISFSTKKDTRLARFVSSNNAKWGGSFSVDFDSEYLRALSSPGSYKRVYLTRYGLPLHDAISALRTYKNLLLIVTDREAFGPVSKRADFNIGISTQPHSSASAIALFLHEFYSGRELAMHFENARYKVVPSERGAHVEKAAHARQ